VTSAEIPAKPAEGAAGRTLGNRRPTWFVVVMSIITFGIYTLYWLYKSFAEVRRVRGQGVSGVVGLLLCFVVVGQFLLPAYVGRMYREEGWDDPPISGWTGLWVLFPYVGGLVLLGRVQSVLNRFWDTTSTG
jgi:Domain of unknown function (DUF4234)